MFNISPFELLLVFIVALIVIGPERLPSTVRTASLWIGRFRRSFYKVKAEIERELNADEIRRQLHNESVLAELEDTRKNVEDVAKDTEKSVNKIVNSANFDPGASAATERQLADEESAAAASGGKSIKEELTEVKEQVEKIGEELYGSGKNPKLAAKEPAASGDKARDDVS